MGWHYLWTNQDSMPWEEKYDNAIEVWDLLINTYGWTEEATAGVIANFQYEGLLNPAQWQIGSTIGDWDNRNVGLGLGQWSPASKIGDYCGGRDQQHVENGEKQVECVVNVAGQWVQRVNSQGNSAYYGVSNIPYYTSIAAFSHGTDDPEDMATAWCACWEGCSKEAFIKTYNDRRKSARYWYDEFHSGQIGHSITFQIFGDGYATAVPARANLNDPITITATPNGNESFIGWSVYSGGITLVAGDNPQIFIMPDNPVIIAASFTGTPPAPPPPPKYYIPKHKMPIWMYPCFRY